MPAWGTTFFARENAHNNFLQIGGELGLAGLAAFVGLLAAAAYRIGAGIHALPHDGELTALSTGLAVFIATWLTGHPLLVAEVAYPFWILLGVAVGRADVNASAAAGVGGPRGRSPWGARAAVAAAAIVIGSVPLRTRAEMVALDRSQQRFGFYEPERLQSGELISWTSCRAAFFVPAGAREVVLPLRAIHFTAKAPPTHVKVAARGRVLQSIELPRNEWRMVRIALPAAGGNQFERIDLLSEPTWVPAVVLGSRRDMRVLGVQLGDVQLF
jgi:hypothetical protein